MTERKPPRPLAFIDTETTGLRPWKKGKRYNEIIDVCVWRTDLHLNVLDKFQAYIMPTRPELAYEVPDANTPVVTAAEITGFSVEKWERLGAVPVEAVLPRLLEILEDTELVGQNPAFDEGFLRAACETHDMRPTWSYHQADLKTLAFPLYQSGRITSRKLGSIAAALGVPHTAHTAEGDVEATFEAFKILTRLYSQASDTCLPA